MQKTGAGGSVGAYEVTVREDGGGTSHQVTMPREVFERLRSGGEPEEEFIRRCFVFLLEREPKESILKEFDVTEISGYFPEFESEISL